MELGNKTDSMGKEEKDNPRTDSPYRERAEGGSG